MNIAFGALLLLILLLPGLLFRVSYLNVRYSGKSFKSTIVDETLLAIAPAFILQVCGYLFIRNVLHWPANLDILYQLIIGSGSFNRFDALGASLGWFLLYNTVLCTFAAFTGNLTRRWVRKNNLHYKYPILKFQNDWYHILKGTILDFPGYEGDSGEIAYVWVDALTESKEGSYLYSGILKEFYLSKEEGLDRLYLTNVRRRKLSDDLPPEIHSPTGNLSQSLPASPTIQPATDTGEQEFDSRYYYMPGDYFVMPYSQIKNLNITYFKGETAE